MARAYPRSRASNAAAAANILRWLALWFRIMPSQPASTLKLMQTLSGLRYCLDDKPLLGGDTLALCFSGGWVIGRFEWNSDPSVAPRFHCSVELVGGKVEPFDLAIPEGALLRRCSTGAIL